MVPVLLLLCRRLGFDPLTAVAMSIGAASVGSAFSPVNPFQARGRAETRGVARHRPASGYRLAFLLPARRAGGFGSCSAAPSRMSGTAPAAAAAEQTPARDEEPPLIAELDRAVGGHPGAGRRHVRGVRPRA